MQKKVSKMSLAELHKERAELKPAIKKMKRNPKNHEAELAKMCKRNLLLKDEIVRRKRAAQTTVSAPPAMLIAA